MNWYQNLYFGKNAEERKEDLVRKIEEGRNPFGLFLIVLPPDEANQLEILTTAEYRKQAARKGGTLIIGMAYGMREAKTLTAEIVGEVYRLTGTAEVRQYYECKSRSDLHS